MASLGTFRCIGCGMSLSKQAIRPLLNTPSNLQNCAFQFTRQYARGNQRQSTQRQQPFKPLVRYLRTLRWVPIPLGFAYISYQQYGHVVKREEKRLHDKTDPEDLLATDWVVRLYRCLPLKILSRLWGAVNNLELPIPMRAPLYRAYSRAFSVNLEEAAIRDLDHYRNLSEFFRRRLRPGVRPIDSRSLITCPSDGVVLHFGKADAGLLEQVKGVTYSLQEFLGPNCWSKSPAEEVPKETNQATTSKSTPAAGGKMARARYMNQLKNSSDSVLYHCVIYLAPGDYHGFHSPTEWIISHRRHYPGELFSVNPGVARLVRGLFNLNERAVYVGHYKHGFFAMAAVGATNVGNIRVYHDQYLSTNEPGGHPKGAYLDESYHALDLGGIPMKKGESFGEFNLGSTVVLIFEAPEDFCFKIKPGQKVRYGEALGSIPNAPQ